MGELNLSEHPHRRLNVLTGDWILVSPHRGTRPWRGQIEASVPDHLPAYDPGCYLCPGNQRAGHEENPPYTGTFVFDNDFSALQRSTPPDSIDEGGLLVAHGEAGICRVVCFSPRHDLTLAGMETRDIRSVVDVWTEEYASLGGRPEIRHVQIFENKGAVMGCSNPHPHGQIWAESTIPHEPAKETDRQMSYLRAHGRSLLGDYLALELGKGERIVVENDAFVVLVPFWAVWPYETLVVSRRHVQNLTDLAEGERDALADIVRRLTVRYDNLFATPFPYSAGVHQSPTDGNAHPGWHLHMHFYPPLLRSATIKKFMVGYEMLANPQRDIGAEGSAARLRELPEA
jgi:UDPglucose--hexose-1-phosphate uridylyltransferase